MGERRRHSDRYFIGGQDTHDLREAIAIVSTLPRITVIAPKLNLEAIIHKNGLVLATPAYTAAFLSPRHKVPSGIFRAYYSQFLLSANNMEPCSRQPRSCSPGFNRLSTVSYSVKQPACYIICHKLHLFLCGTPGQQRRQVYVVTARWYTY